MAYAWIRNYGDYQGPALYGGGPSVDRFTVPGWWRYDGSAIAWGAAVVDRNAVSQKRTETVDELEITASEEPAAAFLRLVLRMRASEPGEMVLVRGACSALLDDLGSWCRHRGIALRRGRRGDCPSTTVVENRAPGHLRRRRPG